jgi:5-methylcytosine-specific restriction endonuclease McrA
MSKELRGTGSNRFDNNLLRKYYNDIEKCNVCGIYKSSDFHHIFHRTSEGDESILNACKICRECHQKDNYLGLPEVEMELFYKVAGYLHLKGYKLKPIDKIFLKNKNLEKLYTAFIKTI